MKLFKKKDVGNKIKYSILGINITLKKHQHSSKKYQPSELNIHERAERLKKKFKATVGYELNLKDPKTLAPAPINTLFPTLGCLLPDSFPVPPKVTP